MDDISIALISARTDAIRSVCEASVRFDADPDRPGVLTNRAWLANAVVNILDGKIDEQLGDSHG